MTEKKLFLLGMAWFNEIIFIYCEEFNNVAVNKNKRYWMMQKKNIN